MVWMVTRFARRPKLWDPRSSA